MTAALFLLIAILSSASMAVVLKIFRKQEGNRYGILLGNYLTCVILAFTCTEKPDPARFFNDQDVNNLM